MERSAMLRVGPGGEIRALSAHFEAFAFTRHEHEHFVIGLIGQGLQTFERGRENFVTPPGYLMLIVAVFVVVFLEIHPFQDGNGRLSRVLTTLLLLQSGYAYVPYSSLESVIETNKEAYYLALRQTQGTIRTGSPDWQPWLAFFLRSLAEQVCRLERKVEREKLVLAVLPELALRIVEFAREHGRVQMGEALKVTGASRNTLKQHFRTLVQRGYLTQRGAGRGVWYELR
jgi:Fic family protein